ncbi:MAG: glycosyltransferase [Eubacterium sp.]|nr:glycosyltransferase [Eubacterium sp.]
MRSLCFAFNHLQYSDGIARSAIGIANYLVSHCDVQVTLKPIYRFEKQTIEIIDERINVKPVFGFFFHGMSKLVNKLPHTFLHKLIFGDNKFDIEIGFQHGTSTIAVTSSNKEDKAMHYVWMHGYDVGLTMLPYLRKADKVVCVSQFNSSRLLNESKGEIKAEFAYNLIDEKKISEDGQQSINLIREKDPVFVTVGRHSEEKGYKRLIRCLSKLKNQGYCFKLWLIGDGPDHQALIDETRRLDMEDCVLFIGAQSNPHKYTSKADVFICSSYSEGYSTACTEAIILGIPVLSTNVSGAEEIINLAESGMIVGNTDLDLENGIKYVLDNPELVQEWKEKLKKTKSAFSMDRRAEKLLHILNLD